MSQRGFGTKNQVRVRVRDYVRTDSILIFQQLPTFPYQFWMVSDEIYDPELLLTSLGSVQPMPESVGIWIGSSQYFHVPKRVRVRVWDYVRTDSILIFQQLPAFPYQFGMVSDEIYDPELLLTSLGSAQPM